MKRLLYEDSTTLIQMQTKHYKRKLQRNIPIEHWCKNPQQNTNKKYSSILKRLYTITKWYSENAKMVQHVKIDQYNMNGMKEEKRKLCDHLSGCIQGIWQHSTSFHNKKKKEQTRNRRKYLNIIKITYLKKANIIYIQQWKTENISSKNRNKTRVSTFATSIQHSTGSSSQSN